jgi:hypothetical protein
MISKNRKELEKQRNILYKEKKRKVLFFYNKGYSLGRISRNSLIDITTVLYILKKSKIKKRFLYKIYEKQITFSEDCSPELIIEENKQFINKFFPGSDNEDFNSSYYWYWKKKYGNLLDKREKCMHKIKNITCANCGKILQDASNIETN